MPTPAAIAGLVMGAVVGAGLLCLGAYAVHRYMDWRCRELVGLFQRNTVRVVKVEDLECNRSRSDEEQENHATGTKQALGQSQSYPKTGESQDMIGLRGGFGPCGLERDPSRGDARQMQPYVSRPEYSHAQPTTRGQALGWHQSGDMSDHLWQPPAVFQQAGPQGGYYANITPQPKVYERPLLLHLNLNNRFGGQSEQARRTMEPISFEGDSVLVVDEYPFIVEGTVYVQGKKRRRTKNKRRWVESRQSSSTELGSLSSDRSSTFTEGIPRTRIRGGALRRTQLPLRESTSLQEHAQHTAHDEGRKNLCPLQSQRRSNRHEREAGGSVRLGSTSVPKFGGRRQAGDRSASEPRMRGRRTVYEVVSKSGVEEEALERHRNAFVKHGSNNSKSGRYVKGSASQAPCKKGKSAVQTCPPRSALHGTRLARTTDNGMFQDAVEQPASDTAIVGTRPQHEVVITGSMSDVLSVRSPVQYPKTPNTFSLVANENRLQSASTPVSFVDEMMTRARWHRSAGAEIERGTCGSISTEASFHKDDRK